ncbi:MAG: hypothetical protein DI589_00210 [Shinella sp.]|nr:MAG: hypothetical protein DI589_00210 [Shinella sp.]
MKYSDNRRIGVVLPSGIMALEREFARHMLFGFTVNYSRITLPVSSSNSASPWGALARMDAPLASAGAGSLFSG